MNLYKVSYVSSFDKEKMYAEVYATDLDSVKEGLNIDSNECASIKVLSKSPILMPKNGEVKFIRPESDSLEIDEEEW